MVNKRKQKIVNPKFQFRMFSILTLFILLVWITTILLVYAYSVRTISEIKGEEQIVRNFLNNITTYNIISLFIVILISYFLVIHLTHKIAGPLFRIENVLKKINKGIIPEGCKIRTSDSPEFISLSNLLDIHIKNLRGLLVSSEQLTMTLDKIMSDNVVDANEIKELRNELKNFEKHFDKFELEEPPE
ncbi:MAG TPA: hypothetical protein ENN73_06880 [Firmicutes bacterium]|nr:hypothetical protein [Bacillota bacterium]